MQFTNPYCWEAETGECLPLLLEKWKNYKPLIIAADYFSMDWLMFHLYLMHSNKVKEENFFVLCYRPISECDALVMPQNCVLSSSKCFRTGATSFEPVQWCLHRWSNPKSNWIVLGKGSSRSLLLPAGVRASSSQIRLSLCDVWWILLDKLWTSSTPLAHHNNRPVWVFECAILCAVCFTWARQWLHLASLLCRGLLRHHGTPAMPHPAPSLAWLCTCPRCWDSWA